MTHQGSSPMIDRPMKAIPVRALSAIGSASLPNFVTMSYLRARYPSMKSVRMASANTTAVPIRQPTSSG